MRHITRSAKPFPWGPIAFWAILLASVLGQPAICPAAIPVTIVFSYSPDSASRFGGEDNIQVDIASALSGVNQDHAQSGTGLQMKIGGMVMSTADPVNEDNTAVLNLVISDPSFQDVRNFAAANGADLVCYFSHSTGAAGNGQQPGMYSAIGDPYVYHVDIAHETGHNLGCAHQDGRTNPTTIMMNNYCGGGADGWFTNPKIWLYGTQLIGNGVLCLGGSEISNGDNSWRIATDVQATADTARVVSGPALSNVIRHWSFNNPAGSAPAGTAITDTVSGTAQAVVRGSGAIFTGSSVRLPGGTTGNTAANSIAAYIDLPNGIISSNTNITIEIWATPLSAPNNAHICDFGNTAQAGDGLGAVGEYTGAPGTPAPGVTSPSSEIMLTAAIGTSIYGQAFQSVTSGSATSLDAGLVTTAGVQHYYAITFTSGTAGGRWQWYRDGDPIGFIDVGSNLANISDVNNWLGRSMTSTDSMANNDYAEIRISNIAMTEQQIVANYLLGPNYNTNSTVRLTADDASGATSFNTAGGWSNGLAPSSGINYETFDFALRTPASSTASTFAGSSLTVTGGRLLYEGLSNATVTVNNLTLNGGEVYMGSSGTCPLAGNLNVTSAGGVMNGVGGSFNLTADLSGSGPMTYVANATTLSGSNSAFTGDTLVGNGVAGTLIIDSEARLGPNPPTLVPNLLSFNRGTLQTSGSMALSNPNRGIFFDVSGGTFNVTSGTLSLACPISSVDMGSGIFASSISKTGSGTLLLTTTNSTFNGTLYVDSGSTTANEGAVRVSNNVVLANAHSPIYITDASTAVSSLQLDGSVTNITLPQSVVLNARNNSSVGIESLSGSNSIGGMSIDTGGTTCIIQCDSGSLNVTGAISSIATDDRVITFQGNGNFAVLGGISNGSANTVGITKLGAGMLTISGSCSNSGVTNLSQGSLKLNGSINSTITAASTLTTTAGTILSGTGSTTVTANIGGTHVPGDPLGTQTFNGPLNYGSAAILNCRIIANSIASNAFNNIAAQGVTATAGATVNFTLNGAGSTVDFSNSFWTQAHVWKVISGAGVSGTFTLGTISNDSAGHSVTGYGSLSLQQTQYALMLFFSPPSAPIPAVPAGFSTLESPGQVLLTWTPAPDGVTGYSVKRSTTSGGPYTTIATGVSGSSYTDKAVTNGVTYYYIITASNPNGESAAAAESGATPHLPGTINKADNTNNLNLIPSWVGGVPNAGDIARWAGLSGANSINLGADLSVKGIIIAITGGAVTIGTGNTLTLGVAGIDMSAASQNLTISSGLTLGSGNQVWNIASGKTLTLATGVFTRGAGATLLLNESVNTGSVATTNMANSGSTGIIGQWAIVEGMGAAANDSASGYTYATISGGNIVAYTGATPESATSVWGGIIDNSAHDTTNFDLSTTGTFASASNFTSANTIRYTGAGAAQNGSGTLYVSGIMNAGTGTFTLGTGLATALNNPELVLAAETAPITINGVIPDTSNPLGITITGSSMVTLAAYNSYTGNIVVNGGKLNAAIGYFGAITTSALGYATTAGRTVTINNGGTLAFTVGNVLNGANQTTAPALSIIVNQGGSLATAVPSGSGGGGGDVNVFGNVTLNGGTLTVGNGYYSGTYQSVVMLGAFTICGSSPSTINTNASNTTANGIMLGGVSGGPVTFNVADVTGDANADLIVSAPLVDAANGAIGALIKTGAGTMAITGVDTYTGGTTVSAGTLQIGASGTSGSITGNVTNNASLVFNHSDNISFTGTVSGAGTLTQQGPGLLTLPGSHSYTGATFITSGSLMVNGTLGGGGAVSVAAGAALTGTGSISGPVIVAAGGSLMPGNAGAGILTLSGALTLSNGSILNMELGTTGSSDQITLGGALSATGTTIINITALSGFGPGTYSLITGTAAIYPTNFAMGTAPSGYGYSLSASNGTLSVLVAVLPSTPTGLTATGSNGMVALSWNASTAATSYNVLRSLTSGTGYTLVASGVTGTSYNDIGVTNGVTYYYIVSASNQVGTSASSTQEGATPVSAASGVYLRFDETSGTTAADSTGDGWNGTLHNGPVFAAGRINNGVSLSGASEYVSLPTGVVSSLTNFTVAAWVKMNSITDWMRLFDIGTGTNVYMFLTPANGATGDVRFAITTSGNGNEQQINSSVALTTGTWTHIAVTLSGSLGTLYIDGTSVGTNSAMTLTPSSLGSTANNYIGRSQYSGDPYLNGVVDEFHIYNYALSAGQIAQLASPPNAPTGVSVAPGNAEATLTWNPATGATGYNAKRSTTNGSGYATVASVTTTSDTDTGLTNGTPYYYVVTTVNGVAESGNSLQVSTTPVAAPAAPTGLAATSSDGVVALNWTASTGATSYNVLRSAKNGTGYASVAAGVSGTSYNDTGLTDGTTYYYVVSASNAGGTSADSTQAAATPSAAIGGEEMLAPAVEMSGSGASTNVAFTVMSSVLGHTYQLQYSANLTTGSWTNIGSPQAGTGSNLIIEMTINPATAPAGFYRILIQRM